MMSRFIIILLFLSILSGCLSSKQENRYDKHKTFAFKKEKTILLPLEKGASFPRNKQLATIDGDSVLITNLSDYRLTFYDLNTRKIIREMGFPKTLKAFRFVNKDSIFILLTNQYNENAYIDSTLFMLIDFEGNVKKYYHFRHPGIWQRGCKIPEQKAFYPEDWDLLKIIGKNKIFFFETNLGTPPIGSREFFESNTPVLSCYDLSTEQLKVAEHFKYPYLKKEGTYYPSRILHKYACLTDDSLPLIRYSYSSDVFKWDCQSDTVITYHFKSHLLDTILPLKEPDPYHELQASYLAIMYDPYRELYYSILQFSEKYYGDVLWTFMIADKHFNYLGEVFQPPFFQPLITKDYFIDVHVGDDKKLHLDYYRLVQTDSNSDDYIARKRDTLQQLFKNKQEEICQYNFNDTSLLDKQSFMKYLKQNHLVGDTGRTVVLTLFSDYGCPGCREDLLKHVSMNQQFYTDKLQLIISGDLNVTKKLIKSYSLQNYYKLYVDSLYVLYRFNWGGTYNPRLTIVDNGKVVLDSVYLPDGIVNDMIPRIEKEVQ